MDQMMSSDGVGGGGTAAVPFNLAEIWPFANNGGGTAPFNLAANLGVVDHSMVMDPSPRKRRENDDSSAAAATVEGASNNTSNANNEGDSKRLKTTNENGNSKGEGEGTSGKGSEQGAKQAEQAPKQDYIHVRARRGQATDSHSLAERARREKISERMKILQDLVPGCNKVIGKALVLDEIINYIQSLQRQVEFLSMKLEAVNSRPSPSIEGFPSKDFGQQTFDAPGMAFNPQAAREFGRGASPEWLHMQLGGGFERST